MTDYQTQQRRRNMVVGAFVVVGFAAFIWMLVQFRNLPLFATQFRSFIILVDFPETPGIQRDTAVQFCGYQIGRVIAVEPPRVESGPQGQAVPKVRVSIAIDNKFMGDIPETVSATIIRRSLGSSFIELKVNPELPVTDHLKAGTQLQGDIGIVSELFPPEVQQKIENLIESITTLSQNTNAIIGDPDNRLNIKKSLENVAHATAQAVDTLGSLQTFAQTSTERLNASAENLNRTLDSIRGLSDIGAEHIEAVAVSLDNTLREFRIVLSQLHSGPGSAARFLNDGRLYENLLDSSKELQLALNQIKKWAAEAREKGIRIKW